VSLHPHEIGGGVILVVILAVLLYLGGILIDPPAEMSPNTLEGEAVRAEHEGRPERAARLRQRAERARKAKPSAGSSDQGGEEPYGPTEQELSDERIRDLKAAARQAVSNRRESQARSGERERASEPWPDSSQDE